MRWTVPLLAMAALALSEGAALGAAGDLDPTFGTGGRQVFVGVAESAIQTLVQPDGKIVLVMDNGSGNFKLRRLNADGTPDKSFSDDGAVTIDFGGKEEYPFAALQPDGKLLIAGRTNLHPTVGTATVVARLDEAGELDPLFSPGGPEGDGKTIVPESFYDGFGGIALRPAGRIALAGTDYNGEDGLAVRLLRPDGSPDDLIFEKASFDGTETGKVAATTADGKIVVAGTTYGSGPDSTVVVARWGADGKLDATFASTGKTTVPAIGDPESVLPLRDGRLLVVGSAPGEDVGTVVVRLKEDGSLDSSYGDGGVARADFIAQDAPVGAGLQADGKLVVAATAYNEYLFGAARFTPEGQLDPTYGSGGIVTPLAGETAAAQSAALMPDGRLVLAGLTVIAPIYRATVLRLLADPPPVVDGGPGGGGGGGGGAGGPAPDTQAPALGALEVTGKVAGRRPRIAFTLSEPARVQLVIKRRGRRAQRFALDAVAGTNRVRAPRRLARARYRLTALATDAAGNASAPVRVGFRMRAAHH